VGRDERLELGDQLVARAGCQVRLEALLQAAEPQLLEARALRRRERLGELGQSRATPQAKGLAQALGRQRVSALERRAAGRAQALELVQVEDVLAGQLECIARRTRAQQRRRQRLTQVRDVDVDHLDRAVGRLLPERVEQVVDRHGAPGIEQEAREHSTLLTSPERDRLPVGPDLERTQDAEGRCRAASLPSVGARANRARAD
jgi:hypothetical protein